MQILLQRLMDSAIRSVSLRRPTQKEYNGGETLLGRAAYSDADGTGVCHPGRTTLVMMTARCIS